MTLTKTSIAAIALALGWENDYEVKEDGLFLQPEEVGTLVTQLNAGTGAVEELKVANATIDTQKTTITDLQATIDTSATETTKLNNRITELEKQVKDLGGQPSGTGTVLETTGDPKPNEQGKVLSINDPEHPLNQFANKKIAAHKKFKK